MLRYLGSEATRYKKHRYLGTPYSMNSLFSEFFKKFEGVFLEVRESISGGILGGSWRENKGQLSRTNMKTSATSYSILLNTI